MLTLQDCIALSSLTEAEVRAIAEHEHVPDIVAAELGTHLCHFPDGVVRIRRIILDEVDVARRRGDEGRAQVLRLVLRHFSLTHPAGERFGDRV